MVSAVVAPPWCPNGIRHKKCKNNWGGLSSLQDADILHALSALDIAIAGGCSGFLTRAIVQPFDVVKIRFQLQVENITKHNNTSKYTSTAQAFRLIYQEEGIKAYWKGHIPAQLLSISFGLVQFWLFETLVKQVKHDHMSEYSKLLRNFTCGAIAGMAASTVSFPFDIMRTRLIAQSHHDQVYRSSREGFAHMIANEGPRSLFKGLTPTITAVAPNAGLQFMFYHFFEKIYRNYKQIPENKYDFAGSMVSGSLAGFLSKILLYPLDLVRKRMQLQGFQKYRKNYGANFTCIGFYGCIKEISHVEGVMGLFKGIMPGIYKALLTSSLNFTTFETICYMILEYKRSI